MAPWYSLIDGASVTGENCVSIVSVPHWTLLLSKYPLDPNVYTHIVKYAPD